MPWHVTESCFYQTTSLALASARRDRTPGRPVKFLGALLFSLVLFVAVGLFTLILSFPIATGASGDHSQNLAFGVASALFGLGALTFVGVRVRAARKNPERRS